MRAFCATCAMCRTLRRHSPTSRARICASVSPTDASPFAIPILMTSCRLPRQIHGSDREEAPRQLAAGSRPGRCRRCSTSSAPSCATASPCALSCSRDGSVTEAACDLCKKSFEESALIPMKHKRFCKGMWSVPLSFADFLIVSFGLDCTAKLALAAEKRNTASYSQPPPVESQQEQPGAKYVCDCWIVRENHFLGLAFGDGDAAPMSDVPLDDSNPFADYSSPVAAPMVACDLCRRNYTEDMLVLVKHKKLCQSAALSPRYFR